MEMLICKELAFTMVECPSISGLNEFIEESYLDMIFLYSALTIEQGLHGSPIQDLALNKGKYLSLSSLKIKRIIHLKELHSQLNSLIGTFS